MPTLDRLCEELKAAGGRALAVATDVSRAEDVQAFAGKAIKEFGAFDTWVNNAGGSVYGKISEVPVEEERKLFEINYWGMVYGSRIAAEHLRAHGGAIINLGSVASDRAIPLQAAYSASKHAIKGYTDALRSELEKDGTPISVTLIKPTAIDTPFFQHAKSYMSTQPSEPSPMYAPEAVVNAILYAAEHPIRDILVGGMAPLQSIMGRLMPRLGDKFVNASMFKGQQSNREPEAGDNQVLDRASGDLRERGEYPDVTVLEHSIYTETAMRPALKRTVLAGTMIALAAAFLSLRRNSNWF